MIRRPPRSTLFPNTTLSRSPSQSAKNETSSPARNSWMTTSAPAEPRLDRKSTRLNSSHQIISYAVFCLKKKNEHIAFMNRVVTLASSVRPSGVHHEQDSLDT